MQACILCGEHSEVTISAVLYMFPCVGGGSIFAGAKRFPTRSNKLRAYFIFYNSDLIHILSFILMYRGHCLWCSRRIVSCSLAQFAMQGDEV